MLIRIYHQMVDLSAEKIRVDKALKILFDKAKLKTVSSNFDKMKLYFRTETGPVVFHNESKEYELICLLMPIRPNFNV